MIFKSLRLVKGANRDMYCEVMRVCRIGFKVVIWRAFGRVLRVTDGDGVEYGLLVVSG